MDVTPSATPAREGSTGPAAGLIAGLVAGGVGLVCLGGVLLLVVVWRRQRRRWRERLQLAALQPALSRQGSVASSQGDVRSLASVASHEWQQHQQLQPAGGILQSAAKPPAPWLRSGQHHQPGSAVSLPTHSTAPAHMLQYAAAAALADGQGAAASRMWRAGSWQDADFPRVPPADTGAPLVRSSSSPQPLPPTLPRRLPPPGSPALLRTAARPPSNGPAPSRSSSWGSLLRLLSGGSTGGGGGGGGGATGAGMLDAAAGGRSPAPAVRHLGSAAADAHDTNAGAAAASSQPAPLQLIPESEPPVPGASDQAAAAAAAGAGAGLDAGSRPPGPVVSRRISPVVSVLEDASSATSNDSLTPAAWHLADRQLLEEQPGWLNIDFATEVRLEKKLGEGGFGQVFCASWRGELIAAKLVPFMSLVAQQHSPPQLTLTSAAAAASGSTAPGAAAAMAVVAAATRPPPLGGMRVGVQFSAASLRAIKVEIRVLSQLRHDHIIGFRGACLAPPHICILEELAEGGSLHSRLYSRSTARRAQQQLKDCGTSAAGSSGRPAAQRLRTASRAPGGAGASKGGGSSSRAAASLPPPLGVAEILRIASDVAAAMAYLHALQPQVIHRDIKPQNVLLDAHGRAKVCDFGISKLMKDASLAASSTRLQGSPAYMAPEQFEAAAATDKVDLYSFAVLLWECFQQAQPWRELSAMQIIYAVGVQQERLPRPARCPDGVWQLIVRCWAHDPVARPSFAEVRQELARLQGQQLPRASGGDDGEAGSGDDEADAHVSVLPFRVLPFP